MRTLDETSKERTAELWLEKTKREGGGRFDCDRWAFFSPRPDPASRLYLSSFSQDVLKRKVYLSFFEYHLWEAKKKIWLERKEPFDDGVPILDPGDDFLLLVDAFLLPSYRGDIHDQGVIRDTSDAHSVSAEPVKTATHPSRHFSRRDSNQTSNLTPRRVPFEGKPLAHCLKSPRRTHDLEVSRVA